MSVVSAKNHLEGLAHALSSQLISYQSNFLATSGKYWQGIQTPGTDVASCPNHDVPTAPDVTRKPTDQPADWTGVFAAFTGSSPVPGAVAVDYYGGPSGQGYDIRLLVRDGTANWVKTLSFGPESAIRTKDWTVTL